MMTQFLQPIRTLMAGFLALLTAYYFYPLKMDWVLLSSLILTQIRIGYLWWHHLLFQFLAMMLVLLIVLFSHLLSPDVLIGSILFVGVLTFLCIYYGMKWTAFFMGLFLINLLALLIFTVNDHQANEYSIASAFFISALVTMVIYPSTILNQQIEQKNLALHYCEQLMQCLLTICIDRDYIKKHLFYEKEIAHNIKKYFSCINILRKLAFFKLDNIERIFENTNACCNLRFRVKDHTTFEMLEPELKSLRHNLTSLFFDGNRDKKFIASIEKMEDVFKKALQVASAEPAVFLFFIYDLKSLAAELDAY